MTADVTLRAVTHDDLPIFYEQQVDPDATRMAAFPSRDHRTFMAHWKKILADDSLLVRTILCEGRVAGNVVHFTHQGEPLVGYWLGKEFWGRGIATRALAQLLPQIATRPLYARVAKRNVASIRVLQKCGFTVCDESEGLKFEGMDPAPEYVMRLRAGVPLRHATVREATARDAAAIVECLREAFEPYRSRYTAGAFEDTVPGPEAFPKRIAESTVLVAVDDKGVVVGTIGYAITDAGDEGHVRGMAARAAWQGQELAQHLLDVAESELRLQGCARITLDTTEPLERAIAFYRRNGFVPSGRVADFFGMPLYEYVKELRGKQAAS